MGDPKDSSGKEGAGGGGGGRGTAVLRDSNAISYDPNANELYHLLFLGLGDVGLVLNVSS